MKDNWCEYVGTWCAGTYGECPFCRFLSDESGMDIPCEEAGDEVS